MYLDALSRKHEDICKWEFNEGKLDDLRVAYSSRFMDGVGNHLLVVWNNPVRTSPNFDESMQFLKHMGKCEKGQIRITQFIQISKNSQS